MDETGYEGALLLFGRQPQRGGDVA